jgi:putative conjugative transposon protein|nr:MAG TPA: replication protein O [Caudoviricetes sp.]
MSDVFNNKESKVLLLNLQLLEVLGKGKVNEALILQQIDYWATINKKKNELFIDNEYWLFSSVNQMFERDFKFCFGVDTLKRALVKLEKEGYIITQKHKNGKLYRVNYQKIDEVYNLKTDKNINIKEIKKDKTENQIKNSELGQFAPTSKIKNETEVRAKCTNSQGKMHQPLGQNAPTINKINYKINIYNNYNNFIKEILSNNIMLDKVKLKLDIDLYNFWFEAIKQDVKQVIANIQATDDNKIYSINNESIAVSSIKECLSSLTEQNINYCTEQILKTKKINIFENYVIASLYNSTKTKNYEFNYNWLED